MRKGCKSKYINPSPVPYPPLGKTINLIITSVTNRTNCGTNTRRNPDPCRHRCSSPATRAAPCCASVAGSNFPSVCTYRPAEPERTPARVRVSSPHEVLYLSPRNGANFQSKIRWEAQYLVQFSRKCASHSLASPALRACRLACPGASSKERQAAREHARRSECLR